MTSDELGKQLHDRATRGEVLSADERAQLEHWYATQDHAEMAELGLTITDTTVTTLRSQVDSSLAQLAAAIQRIQEMTAENTALRHEIAVLRHQLVHSGSAQPA